MDPTIGASVISAAGSLLGNVFGASSTASTNRMNYRIFKEGTQFNREERIAAQNWQKEMLDYQNAYNTPLEQRKRMEDAGYNPYLSNVAPNLSAGASSAPQASAAGAPTMQPFRPDMSGFSQIASMLFQDPLQKATVDKVKADKNLVDEQAIGQVLENAFQYGTFDDRKKAISLNNDLMQQQKENLHAQNDLIVAQTALANVSRQQQEIINEWLPLNQQLNVMTSIVSLDNLVKQGKIMDRQYDKLAYEICYQYLLNQGQATLNEGYKLDNEGKKSNNKLLSFQAEVMASTYKMAITSTNAMHLDLTNMYNSRGKNYWNKKSLYELDESKNWRDKLGLQNVFGTVKNGLDTGLRFLPGYTGWWDY